eukprot:scaffold80621_cov48-Phaeocystis_antarctica.AAC.2
MVPPAARGMRSYSRTKKKYNNWDFPYHRPRIEAHILSCTASVKHPGYNWPRIHRPVTAKQHEVALRHTAVTHDSSMAPLRDDAYRRSIDVTPYSHANSSAYPLGPEQGRPRRVV